MRCDVVVISVPRSVQLPRPWEGGWQAPTPPEDRMALADVAALPPLPVVGRLSEFAPAKTYRAPAGTPIPSRAVVWDRLLVPYHRDASGVLGGVPEDRRPALCRVLGVPLPEAWWAPAGMQPHRAVKARRKLLGSLGAVGFTAVKPELGGYRVDVRLPHIDKVFRVRGIASLVEALERAIDVEVGERPPRVGKEAAETAVSDGWHRDTPMPLASFGIPEELDRHIEDQGLLPTLGQAISPGARWTVPVLVRRVRAHSMPWGAARVVRVVRPVAGLLADLSHQVDWDDEADLAELERRSREAQDQADAGRMSAADQLRAHPVWGAVMRPDADRTIKRARVEGKRGILSMCGPVELRDGRPFVQVFVEGKPRPLWVDAFASV